MRPVARLLNVAAISATGCLFFHPRHLFRFVGLYLAFRFTRAAFPGFRCVSCRRLSSISLPQPWRPEEGSGVAMTSSAVAKMGLMAPLTPASGSPNGAHGSRVGRHLQSSSQRRSGLELWRPTGASPNARTPSVRGNQACEKLRSRRNFPAGRKKENARRRRRGLRRRPFVARSELAAPLLVILTGLRDAPG